MAKKYYAVKRGRKPGVYLSWDACKAQIDGFSGASYKGFATMEEAKAFVGGGGEKKTTCPDIPGLLENPIDGVAVAYVDGSYYHPSRQFSYGAVIAYNGKEYHFSEKMADEDLATMRNVAGEIHGAQCAMRFAKEQGCHTLYLYYDYEGIEKWCTGEWKTNKEGTKAYKEFYEEIKKVLNVRFVKVKGHSNDTYNDLADQLAKEALGLV